MHLIALLVDFDQRKPWHVAALGEGGTINVLSSFDTIRKAKAFLDAALASVDAGIHPSSLVREMPNGVFGAQTSIRVRSEIPSD